MASIMLKSEIECVTASKWYITYTPLVAQQEINDNEREVSNEHEYVSNSGVLVSISNWILSFGTERGHHNQYLLNVDIYQHLKGLLGKLLFEHNVS